MIEDITAVLLVGGLGTRLRSAVPSLPKPLAPLGKTSFLELLVRQLSHQGIRKLVFATGYLGDQIKRQFGDGHDLDVAIEYSIETEPLGTAGAIRLAKRYLAGTPDFIVMNGDSFLEINFHNIIQFHRERQGIASLAVRRVLDTQRYGWVEVDQDRRVAGFAEKSGSTGPGLVNAGVYVFNRALFDCLPEGPASLEKDIFPQILNLGVFAMEQQGMFIDIGTPEDYARAQSVYDHLSRAAFQQ